MIRLDRSTYLGEYDMVHLHEYWITLRSDHMMFVLYSKSLCIFVANWLAVCLGILEVL